MISICYDPADDLHDLSRAADQLVLESLFPRMFAVIANDNNYCLVIDGLAVRPLGIF